MRNVFDDIAKYKTMNSVELDSNFEQRKRKILDGLQFESKTENPDKSPKGFIDEPIIPLIACINDTNTFYTTSSCSGRISLFLQEKLINIKSQKGGEWLLISHNLITSEQITNAINCYLNKVNLITDNLSSSKFVEISLKFEPFILHIECKDLQSAKKLLLLSKQTGFRESGINAISNRIILRITFNLKLEIPLFFGFQHNLNNIEKGFILPNINQKYIEMITNISNNKMRENLSKINIFYQEYKNKFNRSFSWYSSYKNQPHLLSKQISIKMDVLFEKIQNIKQSLLNLKYSETLSMITENNENVNEAVWCLLINNKYKNAIIDKLINLKLIANNHHQYILNHNLKKYKNNWSYIPIKHEFATNIMNYIGCINDNKLRHCYDLYENNLYSHSKKYSFDIDLIIECVTIISYYSQWINILKEYQYDKEIKKNINMDECIIIGLCHRKLPKLETIIYNKSNNKQWCNALILILQLLYDDNTIESNQDKYLNQIINDFPTKYEKLGDCLLFPSSFESTLNCIKSILSKKKKMDRFYEILCQYLKCDQIGLQQSIDKGMKRESRAKLIYDPKNKKGFVKHRENKILYHFNVTKVMFSSGNLTEKIRMGQIAKSTDIVLDLYAGIGYFTLSFLIHANVKFIYCCEINPNSIQSLKSNLNLNKINPNRYKILQGDNTKTTINLINSVDRVNLGLLPTSENGWNPAIRALKIIGGILHIHHNVHIDHKQDFLNNLIHRLQDIIKQYNDKKHWNIKILHCEHVKWYAPKIAHLVIDVKLC